MPERVIGRPRPRHCWEAAASVRSTPYGREVLAFLRPRTNGLFRSRAPIWIQLVRAAREGRLIWHGTESFAVLRRPADRAAPGDGRILRGADREWTLVLLAGAFLVFVVVVLLIVALRGVIGGTVAWYAAALTGTLLLGLFAADQTVALAQLPWRGVRSLVRGRPRRDEVAAEMRFSVCWRSRCSRWPR